MKKLCFLSIFFTLIVSYNSFAGSTLSYEEAAIRKLWKDFERAYNSGDAEAISSLWENNELKVVCS